MGLKIIRKTLPVALLAALIVLAVCIYAPGLKGGFIFDDYPNLEELGNYNGVVDYSTFKAFVFHGISSPLGRPLSLATFLLDSNTWPADPYSFKVTNLKIHLLVGLLVFWATLNLMRLLGRADDEAIWIALLSASIWLLHPYMLSTTLYVVQRMAQLSALFVLIGITGYLHGRILHNRGFPGRGYVWMTASLVFSTPLAVLSKENGILLPTLLLVVEGCVGKNLPPLSKQWKVGFLYLPTLLVAWLLLREINFSKTAWPNRPFTQPERLLTESRIIWEYLYYLCIPHVEGRGLYQDGYSFSRGIMEPTSTLISLVSLSLTLLFALLYRYRYPVFSLGLLFFLAGHLLESTTIGLELYFEHRNYLPSVFLFLPLAVVIVDIGKKYSSFLSLVVAGLVLLLLSFFTLQRAQLWSDTEALQYYWAASTPNSPRAQAKITMRLMSLGRTEDGIRYIEKAAAAMPNSSLLAISTLIVKVHTFTASNLDFAHAERVMGAQPFDPQSVMGLRNLAEDVITPQRLPKYGEAFLNLISTLERSSSLSKVQSFKRLAPYLRARVLLALKDYGQAAEEYKRAIPLHHDVDASLAMVAEMANAGRAREAIMLLDVANKQYLQQKPSTLIRSRESYEIDFKRLSDNLNVDLQAIEKADKKLAP
jgi:tetratricopeptide (TPR) repeat protein